MVDPKEIMDPEELEDLGASDVTDVEDGALEGIADGSSSVKRARVLLAKKNNLTLSDDDPIMGIVTLLDDARDRFTESLDQMLSDHHGRFIKTIRDETDKVVKPVKGMVADLSSSILRENLKAVLTKVAEDASLVERMFERTRRQLFWHAALTGITVFTAMAVMIAVMAG